MAPIRTARRLETRGALTDCPCAKAAGDNKGNPTELLRDAEISGFQVTRRVPGAMPTAALSCLGTSPGRSCATTGTVTARANAANIKPSRHMTLSSMSREAVADSRNVPANQSDATGLNCGWLCDTGHVVLGRNLDRIGTNEAGVDDDHRRRYPPFVRPAAPRSRFASLDPKLIRFIGRRPGTSLPLSLSFPGCQRGVTPEVGRISPAAPLRIAASRRCQAVVQEPHAVLPAATNPRVRRSRSIFELGRRIMAERRRARVERRQRERERQRAFRGNDSSGPTDTRLRQVVRAIARQAARELFDAQRRQHSDSIH